MKNSPSSLPVIPLTKPTNQIAEYIRNIFEDKNGNLWFGTNGYGVVQYDGDSLFYYSNHEGFGGGQITGITEDVEKNIWFATNQGVVKYDWSVDANDVKIFTNYSGNKFFNRKHFWSIFADSKGIIWAGSEAGVFRFDGTNWKPFELPYSLDPKNIGQLSLLADVTTWSISEDSEGNIWFATDGNGAFKFDGKSYVQYTKKDGLTDNSVDVIIEDKKGTMWFGTRFGGVSKLRNNIFTNYTSRDSIGNDEVCIIYEDSKGNIWMSSEGYGVYRYDGKSFTNFFREEGLGVQAVQTIYEDRKGRLWVGGGGGLYRFDGDSFIQVTKVGPWN